jgi:FKBP-type peptidyl-prolyl cis-trans isomerase SlyD
VGEVSEVKVGDGKVVLFHYTLKNDAGDVLDTSDGSEPLFYLHGAGNIVVGLEEQLAGRSVGDKLSATVPADKGYGVSMGPGPQPVERSAFPEGVELEVGMQFHAEAPDGSPLTLWVTALEDDTVLVDANHPLAGVTLHFDIEVTAVRDATEEELAHGHPHGPDGTAGHEH